MNVIEQHLADWKASLVESIPAGGLLARNPVVYKWKALLRVWVVRELVSWRLHDLVSQSYILYLQRRGLGMRILLRSGIETLAMLIYINQMIRCVMDRKIQFNEFDQKTENLLLGSHTNETAFRPVRVGKVLKSIKVRYPELERLYSALSEDAHPNFEGLCVGYSKVDYTEHVTHFSNRWMELYADKHPIYLQLCMEVFFHEYSEIWNTQLRKFEIWIEANDAELEAEKDTPLPRT